MRSTTTVHLVRHGRTSLNAEGRLRGLADPPLDEEGRSKAREAGRLLIGRPIIALLSSPLARAKETSALIGAAWGIEPSPEPGLIDLDHGDWTGLTPAEAESLDPEEFRRFRDDPRGCTPAGGEPVVEVERRTAKTLDDLGARFDGAEIVAVSHEIPLRLLISRLTGLDGRGIWNIPLPTASITTLVGSPGSWRIEQGPRVA